MTNNVTIGEFVTLSALVRRSVEIADFNYTMAAYRFDLNPLPSRELQMLKARSLLRLACSVHGQDTKVERG